MAVLSFPLQLPRRSGLARRARPRDGATVVYQFGATFAAGLRRRRVRAGEKWHLDEVLLKINGKRHWLWRAVDQDGVVLDILVQERRDQAAAERCLHRVLDGEGGAEPHVVITDQLAS